MLSSANFPSVVEIDMANKEQFTAVYNQFYVSLCYYATRYLGDTTEAEDVIGELFSKLWRLKVVIKNENLKGYLYQAALNACHSYQKSSKSVKTREENYSQNVGFEEEASVEHIIRTEVWTEVYNSIESLPPQCATVIKMGYIEGLSNAEIAEKLNLSMQTVKNYKLRGLSILKDTVPKNFLYLAAFVFNDWFS
ncbi:RNA polymerase sigma factor [Pedobacter sp. MW01-1-1]|uniref:RNA polymerase sigma factor n=1 Tax=Pedobacter sp. MW01-1-1 TaxID=3383027 RepID=UPI003FEFB6C6